MIRKINIIISVLVLGLLFSINTSAQGFLRADGPEIINDNGPFLMRGLNLGNWFFNEGYMMEMMPMSDSPTEIDHVIIDMIGKENRDKFFKLWWDNYYQQAEIDTMAALGFNHVRLPLHYRMISPVDSPGVIKKDAFEYIDMAIEMCKKNNMYVLLDMHCVPGSANGAGHGDGHHGYPGFWFEEHHQDRLCDIWKLVADRYKDEPWVAGYDLINEPVNTADQPGNKLMRKVMIRITDSIRTVDTNHLVFVEGNWYGSDFRGLTPPWDDNMVYSFHKYWVPNTYDHMQYIFDIRDNHNVPLHLGEAGENSNHWYGNHIKLLEENNIGWSWWLLKKPNSITAPFVLNFTPGWLRLKDYYKGTIPKPSQEYCTNALLHFAKNTNMGSCEFNPDVYEALMRKDYTTRSTPWPFADNVVPGVFNAAHFDIGSNGVAYKDNVYQTESNNPFLTWNDHWVGRNDGVDMERQTDSLGTADYTVTGIEKGEWMMFTIEVKESGVYNLDLRVAAAGPGGKIVFKLNEKKIGKTVEIPSTVGKYNWKTITYPGFELEAGKHKLKLQFPAGGFNINYFEFKKAQ